MPCIVRPHLTTGGHPSCAEVPHSVLPRFILVPPQNRRNAISWSRQWEGSITSRSNASLSAPFPTIQQGANEFAQRCLGSHAPTLQQGVVNSLQKCLRRCTPTLQQGAMEILQKCHCSGAPALFGAVQCAQRCHSTGAPTTRGQSTNTEMSIMLRLA